MSIYGAIAGGILVGLSEVLGTRFLAGELGSWLIAYRPLIPLAFIGITLMIAPSGLAGVRWGGLLSALGRAGAGRRGGRRRRGDGGGD